MADGNYFVLRLPCRSENVGLTRIAVASLATQLPFGMGEVEEIKVAVSEAVSNAVLHAYDDDGEVEIRAEVHPGQLIVIVTDWGRGIGDVDQACQAGFSTLPDRMGLGFAFMQSFMDSLDIESGTSGTVITMKKHPGGTLDEE